MELRQRKRINNLPKFDIGQDLRQQAYTNMSQGELDKLDAKLGVSNQQNVANDLMKTNEGINMPKGFVNPGSWKSSSIGATGGVLGNVSAGTVTSAVNGTLGVISGFNQQQAAVKGQGELFSMSGQRTDQAFGVNYQAQNDIDKSQAMADISASNKANTLAMTGSGAAAGAAIGSVVPGVGTLIGGAAGAIIGGIAGLFGGRKSRQRQRKRIQNAQQNANLINQVNRSSAASEGLQQQYYMDNGTTYDDLLYANRGKDLKRPRYDKSK